MGQVAYKDALENMSIDDLCVDTIRTLAMDAVEKAQSGHPGTPMALAPAAYVLWTRFLRHNPRNPHWFDRDRFVLSCGHASMLLYAMLHLSGYELSMEDIRNFRQWDSRTPGHPEYGLTPGVETTTGPLGQGIMNAVGMALAEARVAELFNREGHHVVDHNTYVFCSDGDMMEGASHEAASLAGHLGLGKLICLYDENHISIDGETEKTLSDDTAGRFKSYQWHVQDLGEKAEDLDALTQAFEAARAERERPSLIIVRSHIARGAPHKQDTAAAHGAPLGEEEIREAKRFYGWPEDAHFFVPDRVYEHMRRAVEAGAAAESRWQAAMEAFRYTQPEQGRLFDRMMEQAPPPGRDADLPEYPASDSQVATRAAAADALNHFARHMPWLVGGAGDLASSTKAYIKEGGDVSREDHAGRNVCWGVREHVMCAACSGMALHGGVRPFASTFLIFTDYARPAIRLSALMGLPVIYLMSHDSVGLGEDGPTHQPVEHLASLRAMPNMCVIRPADANETVQAMRVALQRIEGPTLLALTRQKLPVFDRELLAGASGLERGAYVLSPCRNSTPDLILMASGSEVHLALGAQGHLATHHGIDASVVSMPSWELFREQPRSYRDEVLPPEVTARVAVEAGSTLGWCEWIGDDGVVVGLDRFGASAPGDENLHRLGFTVERVVEHARTLMGP